MPIPFRAAGLEGKSTRGRPPLLLRTRIWKVWHRKYIHYRVCVIDVPLVTTILSYSYPTLWVGIRKEPFNSIPAPIYSPPGPIQVPFLIRKSNNPKKKWILFVLPTLFSCILEWQHTLGPSRGFGVNRTHLLAEASRQRES